MNSFILLLFAVYIFSLDAQSQPKVLIKSSPEAGGFSASRLHRLDSSMTAWVNEKWVNGSVALIARHGKIVFYNAHGYNDDVSKTPLDKNGIFRIASQTK